MACRLSPVPLAACTAAGAAKILHRLGKSAFLWRLHCRRYGRRSRRKERSNDARSPRFAPGRRGLWIAVVRGLPYRPCHEGMWAESV